VLHHQATQETTPQALPNRVYRHLFPKKETSCQFLIHNSELHRIELVVSATKTPKGFLVVRYVYNSRKTIHVWGICKAIMHTDRGVGLKNSIGVNLGNDIGVNLGITPHPPVLIHRSESTLPLVVMALNNPLLL
jgi:hypothetical protein